MTDCIEIALTSDTSAQHWSCCAWDVRTGTQLMTYRNGGPPGPNTLNIINNQVIVAGHLTKPLLTAWPINRQEPSKVKYMLPAIPGAVAVGPDGNFCIVAHGHSFNVYNLKTGDNMASVSQHYGKINVLRFTDDGSHFISAGQDCRIIVWNLSRTVQQKDNGRMLYELADFTLPVSDVVVGKGGMKATLAAISLDRSCKLYDLANGKLFLNIVFPVALSVLTMNALETELYVGDKMGSIYACNLQSVPRSKEIHLQQGLLTQNIFMRHEKAITCLSVSMDCETLLSGSEDGTVIVWHVKTRQKLKVLPHKASITNAFFLVMPRAMFNQSLELPVPFPPFHKVVITRQERERISIEMPASKRPLRERLELMGMPAAVYDNDNAGKIQELEQEIEKLKAINQQLYQQSIQDITNEKH
uniref:WD repeat-containing protein 18 n=1 Tax=Anopheles minimus TaxID=112268 RepID=A0A182WD28_9DIPT